MKILNFCNDRLVLNPDSAVSLRVQDYAQLTERYTIICLGPQANRRQRGANLDLVVVKDIGNKFLNLWSVFITAFKLCRRDRYDLISVQDIYYLAALSYLLKQIFRLGLEVQVHGLEKYHGLRKFLAQWIWRRAESIRVVSPRLARYLINDLGLDSQKITVVPIYVSTQPVLFNQSVHEELVFLTVGRLVPVKNIALQLNAYAKITQAIGPARLKIVGTGPLQAELEAQAKVLGIADQVDFLGWQPETASFYQAADIFLLTSCSEGWPLVIIEALRFGLPIIMTDVGSAGDLIKHEQNGLVVPVKDLDALALAMKNLAQDPAKRRSLGLAAKQTLPTLATKETIMTLYQESWQKALKHNK